MERDSCYRDEIAALPADQAASVAEKAGLIEDEMIRGSAVAKWVADNANQVSQADGQTLCNLLTGRDRSYCQRRLSSPHLQR